MTPTIASLLAALLVWGTRIEWRVRRGQRPGTGARGGGWMSGHDWVYGDLLDEPGISDRDSGQWQRRLVHCSRCGEERKAWKSATLNPYSGGGCPWRWWAPWRRQSAEYTLKSLRRTGHHQHLLVDGKSIGLNCPGDCTYS